MWCAFWRKTDLFLGRLAPHRTDSIIRLTRGRPGERFFCVPLSTASLRPDGRMRARRNRRGIKHDAGETPASTGLSSLLNAAVEKAMDAMAEAFPIHRLREMRGKTGCLCCRDVTIRSETAESDPAHLAGAAQLA